MNKLKFVVLFFLLVFATTAQADWVQTTVGSGADTTISNDDQSYPAWDANSTHGGDTDVKVRTLDGVRLKIAYLRFDITDNTQFDSVSGARLGLNVTYSRRTRILGVFGLADSLDNWDEATICYNNAPGFIPNPPTALGYYAMDANLTRVADLPVTQDVFGWYYSTPSAAMDAFINADTDGLVTFAVLKETTDSNADWSMISKEGNAALAPILVPEPATIALLGLGGLALLRRKR